MADDGKDTNSLTEVDPQFLATEYGLTWAQDNWISYCATGGLITTEDGRIDKMTLDMFVDQFKTPMRTLYNWKKSIPDFDAKVRKRRADLFPQSRETNIWNRAYLIAMTTKGPQAIEAIKLLAGQFSSWQPPSQKHDVELGASFMDLLQANRMKRMAAPTPSTFIEAETNTADATANTDASNA